MKKTIVSHLMNKQSELTGIRVETEHDTFVVPVVDVRRSPQERARAERILKAVNIHNGSKFFNPSYSLTGYSYNISRKK